ncbi:vWA domain-containing protein [Ureibacillus aquaedulcis]|uniref:BatA and WFA domain-containing protein n=1 Tax=Ureibacillus aquaedulcis TaxID=3058421 RepID=A0ABT8GVK6_9BACL|nr:BatA and WFA domain-containing protein [Ureibacillus sp. BA0131]MDN4495437.1 BatA and WFA domain-containing protein [Ureibacillus sp. BA0131]
MGFTNLLFIWTAFIPVIVLLYYFFRKKYKDQPVSSTLFWDEAMQETKASPYLRHLQQNALLYLQLLALILFVLALMNPFVKTTEIEGEQSIWIVDTSASMLAKDGESTTFDRHKEEMKSLAKALNGRPVTIITTGEEPKAIVRQETRESVIHKAIEEIEVAYEEEQLSKAFDMASAFIGETATSVYLFTDSVERGELPIESDKITWVVKGASKGLENVSITRLVSTALEGTTLALIQLKNEAESMQVVQLSLLDGENKRIVQEEVALQGGEEWSKTFEDLPMTNLLTATIQAKDDYKMDNAMVTLVGSGTSEIVIDQQMHQLVQKGFQALNADVKIVPADQLLGMADAMVVTNQKELLQKSASPIVLIGRDDVEAQEVNALVDMSQDSLFAFSSLEDVYVSSIYPAFDDFATIATIDEKPFVQRSPRGDIVILADIEQTDWPLHPSFPLLLWGIQNELIEGTQSLGTFSPGESRAVSLSSGEWSIYSGEGEYISTVEGGGEFRAPATPGVYTISSKEEEKQFIVELSSGERSIQEGTSFELGAIQNGAQEETTKKSFVQWLLIPILLLLVLEWEVQRRRGFAN